MYKSLAAVFIGKFVAAVVVAWKNTKQLGRNKVKMQLLIGGLSVDQKGAKTAASSTTTAVGNAHSASNAHKSNNNLNFAPVQVPLCLNVSTLSEPTSDHIVVRDIWKNIQVVLPPRWPTFDILRLCF